VRLLVEVVSRVAAALRTRFRLDPMRALRARQEADDD